MARIAFELENEHGLPLRGDVYSKESVENSNTARPVIVVCHGFKGFKDWGFFPHLGETLGQAGFHAVVFNFSGSGIGEDLQNFSRLDLFEQDTVSKQVEDLGRIIDAVQSNELGLSHADPTRIGVVGHSRGGGVCLIRAREDSRIQSVVTWASISKYMHWSMQELEAWKERGYKEFLNSRTNQAMRIHYDAVLDLLQNSDRFDLPSAMREIRVPVLIVHGEKDQGVHPREAQVLRDAADPERCEMQLIAQAGHTFGAVHPWAGSTEVLETAMSHSIAWFRRSFSSD